MSRLRFHTDEAVFEMFPSARHHVGTSATGVPPFVFVGRLVERGALPEALSFCAYVLPRREAVAWGCGGLRAPPFTGAADRAALDAAEAWVETPHEEARAWAYGRWRAGDREDPATWLALAAAWSGGSLIPDRPASPQAPRHLTATTVRVALLLALHRTPAADKPAVARSWIAQARRLAEDGL